MHSESFDVVIIGAGLSGIGAACHLQDKCPDKRYLILESRDALGGTWDLFRFPGIRSDSDMYTLGYNFKPWCDDRTIADGPSILRYIRETATEHGVIDHIRFRHKVIKASWSSKDALWTVEARHQDTNEIARFHCDFIMACPGYYRYEQGYLPEFEGIERFAGEIVHPQHWPDDLDYRDRRIAVIGSGSTAVTMIPELAKEAKHVVMVQRSPSYVVSVPEKDPVTFLLRRLLPEQLAYRFARWKNIRFQLGVYRRARKSPDRVRRVILGLARKDLGNDFDVDPHFSPRYDPWDQRLCVIPDGDLFHAIRSGSASVVTGEIETFTENGLRMRSDEHVDADIVITATGLDLVLLGGIDFVVDRHPVDFAETFSYRSIMFSDVPNLVSTFGYINASWTLKSDLTAEYACRLLNYMQANGHRQCTPRINDEFRGMPAQKWITAFSSGYVQRKLHLMPKQGDRQPWLNTQDYGLDRKLIPASSFEDGVLEFANPAVTKSPQEVQADAA